MIERFSITASEDKISERFGVDMPYMREPKFNAAPTHLLPLITSSAPNGVSTFYWGTSPEWSKNKMPAEKLVNTRVEFIQEKISIKKDLLKNRCIIPADSFFAWKRAGKKTLIPYRFVFANPELVSFAGIWEEFEDNDGNNLHTFSIITTPANELVGSVHDRMPAVLDKQTEKTWLNADATEEELLGILKPYPSGKMNLYTVSPRINDPQLNVPSLIIATPPADQFGNLTLFD